MSLRAKLFLPLLAFSLLLITYAHFGWLPQFRAFVIQEDNTHQAAHLRSVAEGLVPLLLENQLANIYDNLDSLLENNPDWTEIQLVDTEGGLLYPLEPPSNGTKGSGIATFQQPVTYLDHTLGSLTVTVDISEDLRAIENLQRYFMVALLLVVLAFIVAIASALEWVVRRPLGQLSVASDQLAKGNFDTELPQPKQDEVGSLVESFALMRNAIQSYQADVGKEIENHKRTAEALYEEKERFSYHASHDALTGLVNRREFEHRTGIAMDRARQDGSQHVLLYLDLDQFKIVNDTSGHVAGDELLRKLGPLMEQKIRGGDTLARLGGDEFGILLEFCPPEKGVNIANQLREIIQDYRFAWEDNIFAIGASIGVVVITAESDSLAGILSAADAACYAAKDKGRNRVHVYQADDTELARRKGEMQWVSRVTKALEEDRFTLYYQSIVPTARSSDEMDHFEILIRMLDEDGGRIPPGAFIPAAERYNLMGSIDRWVVQRAFAHLSVHNASHSERQFYTCAINLSGASVSDETFLEFIAQQFREHSVTPESICFEITETAAIAELAKATALIKELKKIGCRFALDDFGSGLSSFAYLKNLPVDYLKIDGVFVKDILQDPIDYAMVKSINEIGHVMGMQTIAEFVENEAIFAKLQEIKVDFAQGYGISRPAPLEDKVPLRTPVKQSYQ